jgi:uncharacterized membrane protein
LKAQEKSSLIQTDKLLLPVILITGTVLRLLGINTRSFWLDETISAQQARLPIAKLLSILLDSIHPPLYHILLHFWIKVVGNSEIALRSLSIFFGLASILAFYFAGKIFYKDKTAPVAAATVALSPFFIWYSQEARMYSLLILFTLISITSFYLAITQNKFRHWFTYIISITLALYTHYLATLLFFFQITYFLIFAFSLYRNHSTSKNLPLKQFLAVLILIVLLFSPWFTPYLAGKLGKSDITPTFYGWKGQRHDIRFDEILKILFSITLGYHTKQTIKLAISTWPFLIFVCLMMVQLIRPLSRPSHYLLFMAAVPSLFLYILDQWKPTLNARYFLIAIIPAYLLISHLLVKVTKNSSKKVVAIALISIALIAWYDQTFNPNISMHFANREALSYVSRHLLPSDAIIISPFYMIQVIDYYLPEARQHAFYKMPFWQKRRIRNRPTEIKSDVKKISQPFQRVWLIASFQGNTQVKKDTNEIKNTLRSLYEIEDKKTFPQVEVILYQGQK